MIVKVWRGPDGAPAADQRANILWPADPAAGPDTRLDDRHFWHDPFALYEISETDSRYLLRLAPAVHAPYKVSRNDGSGERWRALFKWPVVAGMLTEIDG